MDDLVPMPSSGRRFHAVRQVRLSDADPAGGLRLDALASYLQDVAADDARDAELEDALAWVVRRLVIEVVTGLPRLGEEVALTTWCSGTGSRWAERRTTVHSETALVEAAAVWVPVDAGGRPARLSGRFHQAYDDVAAGRRVSARLTLPDPPVDATWAPWPLRRSDLDLLGHVNNAAYFHAVEEVRSGRPVRRATIEYRKAISGDAPVDLAVTGETLWLAQDGAICAASRVESGGLPWAVRSPA
jgi:acyl-ACP thioesterase